MKLFAGYFAWDPDIFSFDTIYGIGVGGLPEIPAPSVFWCPKTRRIINNFAGT
jgi:hypothetical protein